MAIMKEAMLTQQEFLDNLQKFVLCGRVCIDALEQLAALATQASSPVNNADALPDRSTAEPERCQGSAPDRAQKAEMGTEASRGKTATLEEVRSLLTEKSRIGYRAEVKALLTAFGAARLTEITDPFELGRLLDEAEKIGVQE